MESASDYPDPLLPIPEQHKADNPGETRGWWPAATASIDYIDPSEGGVAGELDRLPYSTGLYPRSARVQPFDGRMLTAPPIQAHPPTGPVGRDNLAGQLQAGVRQQTASLPDLATIAQAFTSMRGVAGLRRGMTNG